MSRLALRCIERGLLAGCGVAVLVWAPVAPPQPRTDVVTAACAGVGSGLVLFAALARHLPPPRRWCGKAALRATAIAAPVLSAAAVAEESIWRYLLLGVLRSAAGATAALAVATATFAAAHAGGGIRAVRIHLVTGACFGAAYVASGRLITAIAAHLAYNLFVVAARAGPAESAQPVGAA